ncbi:YccF domain-containing protein [Plebeiibacterium marinum]|uniref:YccF domain-containing protein n=1 Tax=Plebeiibacterium marinum TaxID=2992111 RepID=A0AAE3SKL3_9BACT|nr:YccF domain-containing protein [Plebeiobacterium marinum]MCW3806737.1 YccF domain-containing protein [Plebeiobacterium marinum]
MNLLGNIIWLIFGGFMVALEYLVASIILMVTIIGIPFGLQTLKLASLAFWPFGRETVASPRADGCLSLFMNILWLLVGGIWIALSHVFWGLILCITIIGIPFGKQHFKLASIALTPFGREIRYKR